ncbi:two-component system sensor histidine kinase CreC [Aliamphritea ceti]|uniref:two-component system sensor histidine kinase CreC n=1 Tax=Aliamphritea ceti TaxID=1524258 RepID=UPI0021C37FE3|nr:two-component system sensor histidine kinase CreC [Aliamphritea ceti]
MQKLIARLGLNKFGVKLFLAYFAILGLGIYLLLNTLLGEIKPGLRQAMETALVDTANLMAEYVAPQTLQDPLQLEQLAQVLDSTLRRPINATIWSHKKTATVLRVYVTDVNGRVVFDSAGRDLGADYSRWNDVYLTLRGEYGARSTQENPGDEFSSVMYISAPIYARQDSGSERQIVGVLAVGKSNISVEPFWQLARDNIRSMGVWLLVLAALLGALLSTWLSLNIGKLVSYARQASAGSEVQPPRLSDPDLAALAQAMDEMRTALDGKQYIESYTLSLTHEMKSPLTALQGAAELIAQVDDREMRQKLAGNIELESKRLRALVDQVLSLARLENRQQLEHPQTLQLNTLLQQELSQLQWLAEQRQVSLLLKCEPQDMAFTVSGDEVLLAQALRNLLENALDFSPQHSDIEVLLRYDSAGSDFVVIEIFDQGSGIPEYALEKVWQRFYSLPRPATGLRSTGLGLSFVQQIAKLHAAELSLDNRPQAGVVARLRLPLARSA